MKTSSNPPTLLDVLPPDSLDIIPQLSQILSRLETSKPSINLTSTPAATPSHNLSSTGPLSPKDIPAATDPLKHKIQKARSKVGQLSDMHRTIPEQEEEIGELEARIKDQREVLARLKGLGEKFRLEKEA